MPVQDRGPRGTAGPTIKQNCNAQPIAGGGAGIIEKEMKGSNCKVKFKENNLDQDRFTWPGLGHDQRKTGSRIDNGRPRWRR